MSLDLAYDDGQQAIHDALDQFCGDQCDDTVVRGLAGRFPESLWRELCELGVLEAATPEGDGGALEVTAAMEALGRWVVPGPWAACLLATQILDGPERQAVAGGDLVVSAGVPPLMPWASSAGLFLEVDGRRVWRLELEGEVEPVETLGGEPWGRVSARRVAALPSDDPGHSAERGYALYHTARAAYLAAAGERLLEAAANHARARVQFGRSIGEFQAVAHPMADCSIGLAGAAALARAAAWRLDTGPLHAASSHAAAARLSANRAALETVNVCHQVFGAIGITLEGPAYHYSRRIRQLASEPPNDGAARAMVLSHFQMPGRES